MIKSILTDQDLWRLTDYILLNSCSVNSSGFYNGKAGMSLSLFQVARYKNNDALEDKAFELIQEALLAKNTDIGFENGIFGVGYVFFQLIQHKYIDADFEDFFGEQIDTALNILDTRKHDSQFMIQSFPVVLCLNRLNAIRTDARIENLLYLLFEEMERYLSMQLFHFESIAYNINRMEIPTAFRVYLQYAQETNYLVSPALIDAYITLYQKGRISSSYSVGYFLGKIENNSLVFMIANENKTNALKNLKPSFLSLREHLNLLSMLRTDRNLWNRHGKSLEQQLINAENNDLEQSLLASFVPGTFHAGYGFGVARFLSYCTGHYDLI